MSSSHSRAELLGRLEQALRKVGAHSVLMSDAVATRVGINSTDLECLDLLHLAGASTPGWLARQTGLTTGAMTAVIDRLERAGFVRRSPDPQDRRRVLVDVRPAGIRRIAPLYQRLAAATARLNAEFDDRQLSTVAEYLSRSLDLLTRHVAWLQTQGLAARAGSVRPPSRQASGSPPRHRASARPGGTRRATAPKPARPRSRRARHRTPGQ